MDGPADADKCGAVRRLDKRSRFARFPSASNPLAKPAATLTRQSPNWLDAGNHCRCLVPWHSELLWLEWVTMKSFLLIIAISLVSGLSLSAQIAIPAAGATTFKDTSMLKPPSGAKVAIIEFEDLECPLCAQVSPLVRDAMSRYQIPRVHHDFIIQGHAWSRTAAIYARFLEDKVAPQVAEDFRRDVFANQRMIAGQDDLQQFTRRWFQSHGQQMPFVIDPSGRCRAEVEADCTLGQRLGVLHTPTIIVVTAHKWIEVTEPNQLYAAIDLAESDVNISTRHAR